MMGRLDGWIKKRYEILAYLFFGVLTTVINYMVYLPCYNLLQLSAALSNAVAWVVAVVFAYLTNKIFVFRSRGWSGGTVIPELTKFLGSRVASGVMETGILFLTVDGLLWNGNMMKPITGILVVAANYMTSKLFVFWK